MTTYHRKDIDGCVVHEYRVWQAGVTNTPIRTALSAVDTTHLDQHERSDGDGPVLRITDMAGTDHTVTPGWFVVQRTDDYLNLEVYSPEEFAAEFEVTP